MKPQDRVNHILDSHATATEKLVLIALASRMQDKAMDAGAWPGPAWIAKKTSLGPSTVKAALASLKAKGVVSVALRPDAEAAYKFATSVKRICFQTLKALPEMAEHARPERRKGTTPVQQVDGGAKVDPVQEQDGPRPAGRRGGVQEQDGGAVQQVDGPRPAARHDPDSNPTKQSDHPSDHPSGERAPDPTRWPETDPAEPDHDWDAIADQARAVAALDADTDPDPESPWPETPTATPTAASTPVTTADCAPAPPVVSATTTPTTGGSPSSGIPTTTTGPSPIPTSVQPSPTRGDPCPAPSAAAPTSRSTPPDASLPTPAPTARPSDSALPAGSPGMKPETSPSGPLMRLAERTYGPRSPLTPAPVPPAARLAQLRAKLSGLDRTIEVMRANGVEPSGPLAQRAALATELAALEGACSRLPDPEIACAASPAPSAARETSPTPPATESPGTSAPTTGASRSSLPSAPHPTAPGGAREPLPPTAPATTRALLPARRVAPTSDTSPMLPTAPDRESPHQPVPRPRREPDTSALAVVGLDGAPVALPGDLTALLFDLDAALAAWLAVAGVETSRDLLALTEAEIQMVPRIGAHRARRIAHHLRERWGVEPGCLAHLRPSSNPDPKGNLTAVARASARFLARHRSN